MKNFIWPSVANAMLVGALQTNAAIRVTCYQEGGNHNISFMAYETVPHESSWDSINLYQGQTLVDSFIKVAHEGEGRNKFINNAGNRLLRLYPSQFLGQYRWSVTSLVDQAHGYCRI